MVNFALFSEAVYKQPQTKNIEGFKRINEHSTAEHALYLKKNAVIFAIRGTANMKKDIATDLALGLGQIGRTKRYKSTKKAFQNILDDYPNHKVYITGHSLAGGLAIRLGQEKKFIDRIEEIHIYNAGTSIVNLSKKIMETVVCKLVGIGSTCKLRKKLHIHRTLFDPISILSPLESTNIHTNTRGIHTISNFTTKPLKEIRNSNK